MIPARPSLIMCSFNMDNIEGTNYLEKKIKCFMLLCVCFILGLCRDWCSGPKGCIPNFPYAISEMRRGGIYITGCPP